MVGEVFKTSVLIRFSHCDPAGIVFYPRYFEMINNVVEDWMAEALDWSFSFLIFDRNEGFPTVSVECEFMSPSRIGDVLDFELTVLKLGKSSCTVSVSASKDGVEILKAVHVLVYTSRSTEEGSIEIPLELRERMMRYHVI